jgi:hypothetical protein
MVTKNFFPIFISQFSKPHLVSFKKVSQPEFKTLRDVRLAAGLLIIVWVSLGRNEWSTTHGLYYTTCYGKPSHV